MAERPLALALNTAWRIYLVKNSNVRPDDARRCNLERYLALRLQAGATDTEELTVDGLTYLRKLDFLQYREFN